MPARRRVSGRSPATPQSLLRHGVPNHEMTVIGARTDIRLGIAGDSAAVAARIDRVLRRAGGYSLAHLTVEELSGASPEIEFDIVLLHVLTDEDHAAEVVTGVRSVLPGVATVALWQKLGPTQDRRLRRLGLDGVVLVDDLETALVPTVRAVSAGLICVPSPLRGELQRENLSGREKQVLGMVVMGSTNAEIAARLFLAESTVKSHLSSAYEKLGVSSRKDAAALILDPTAGLDRGILAISAA